MQLSLLSLLYIHPSSGNVFQRRTFPFLWVPRLSLWLIYSRFSTNWFTNQLSATQLKIKFMLQPTVGRPVCLGVRRPSGAHDQICITVRQLRLVDVGSPFWREDMSVVYNFCWSSSAESFSDPSTTGKPSDWRLSQPRGPGPCSPRNRVIQLYPPGTGFSFRRLLWFTGLPVCFGVEPRLELMIRCLLMFDSYCSVRGGVISEEKAGLSFVSHCLQ
jgi:hypothetical protein